MAKKKETTKKECLGVGCGKLFESTGPGNRLCYDCKSGKRVHGKTVNSTHNKRVNRKRGNSS